jgi:hypothetical protein
VNKVRITKRIKGQGELDVSGEKKNRKIGEIRRKWRENG